MAWSLSTGKKKLLLIVAATLILRHSTATDGAAGNSSVARPGCQDQCGNVSIAYPFGIGTGCFLEGFEVTCVVEDHHYVPFLNLNTSVEGHQLLDINVTLGEARVLSPVSWYCIDKDMNSRRFFVGPHFTISRTMNKFTAIGCSTIAFIEIAFIEIAFIEGKNKHEYISGCTSSCDKDSIDNSGQCTGMGCCQTFIPDSLNSFQVTFDTSFYHNTSDFSPCSYGFVVDENYFSFEQSYVSYTNFKELHGDGGVPLVIDWVVGNETCAQAKKNLSSYPCRGINSYCTDVPDLSGYLCNCSQGYEGNPYLDEGCRDINECDFPRLYPCKGRCKNTNGNYACSCPLGTQSTDPKNESCIPNDNIIIGLAISFIFMIACIFIALTKCEKRKLAKEKETFFKQNGGQILYQQMLAKKVDTVTIFTIEDLKKATNNFDKSRECWK